MAPALILALVKRHTDQLVFDAYLATAPAFGVLSAARRSSDDRNLCLPLIAPLIGSLAPFAHVDLDSRLDAGSLAQKSHYLTVDF